MTLKPIFLESGSCLDFCSFLNNSETGQLNIALMRILCKNNNILYAVC